MKKNNDSNRESKNSSTSGAQQASSRGNQQNMSGILEVREERPVSDTYAEHNTQSQNVTSTIQQQNDATLGQDGLG